ncbi:hypothetical protein [Streptosporangium sp. KLBMP 9127]|nr:hypothetical protein [Streptosporangium sp. KLBMP 9127]
MAVVVVAGGLWLFLRPASGEGEGAGVGVGEPGASAPAAAPATVTLAQPSGHHGEAGYPIGFPHTELGAASAAAATLEAVWTLDPVAAEQAAALYAPPDQREAAQAGAKEIARGWRETFGLPKDGALPAGAAMRTTTIGVQWRAKTADQIQVSILVEVKAAKGTDDTGPAYASPYAMNLLMTWNPDIRGGDWVNIPDPQPASIPAVAKPGTPEFRTAGWKPITGPTS